MSKWKEYKEKNGVTPLDMLNPKTKHTTKEIFQKRIEICKACPELIGMTTQCKKCGCFMSAKARLESAKCPLGKW